MAFALPAAATAMAAAAPAAAAAAATKVTLMAVAKSVLMNVAISAAMTALQPQVGSAGRTFEWTLDPNAPIPFAAGRVGVAGTVAHLETYGPDKMYYGFVSILSGAGPIRGVTGFKGDDEVVTFDGNGKAISSQWAGEMWMRSRLGTQPDTALTNPPGLKSNAQLPGWTAAHKLSGKACYMLVLGENSKRTAYPTGEPKPLVTIEGLYGWDPRQDSTYPGGAGPCRLNNPATWVWLDNPILWGLKWALGLWEGPTGKGAPGVDYQVGGIGAKVEGIRVDRFVAAANVADANGWKVAAYPTTDDDKSQVLDTFLQAGGAIYAQEQGKISCIQRAAPRASIVTITAADTAGPLEIDTAASRIDRINTIRPRFWSEAHRWQMTAIDDVTAESYRTEDGAVRPRGIDFAYVPLATQAAQLAGLQIANTREPIAGTIPLKPHLRNIGPGTAFTISEPGFLLDGLKCLCLNSDYDPATGVVSVTFVSETDAKYPFALGQSPVPPAPPVLTAPDLTVTPPQPGEWTLAAANFVNDGVSVPALLFAGSVENSRAISVIFEFRPVGAADWSGAGIEDPTIERKEAAGGLLTPGVQYEGAVSYRVGGNISTRLVLDPVTAGPLTAGEVAPVTPGNVAGVPSLAITTTIAPDGTQTSRMFGDFADASDAVSYVAEIDDGTLVQQVPLAESAIEDRVVATGPTYRYRVRAVSRTGTPSAAWSAWSNQSTAGGDNTAPGPITAPYIQGGIGQIAMRWTNPGDDDLHRVLIFRNTTGQGPELTGEAPYAWATGTSFIDQAAEIGTVYYYWGLTQDRTGNGAWANLVYIGTASARRTRFDTDLTLIPPRLDAHPIYGGDYMRTDRLIYDDGVGVQALKPLEGGANKTETRTAAAFVGQGLLATKNTAHFFNDTTGRPTVMQDGYFDSGGFLYGDGVRVGGVQLNNRWPAENGANVTEGRTAAAFTGQGLLATKNQANFATDLAAVPARLEAHPVFGDGYMNSNRLIYYAGGSIDSLKPGEPGSNVTETRTASAITGQGFFATQNFADWSSRITGAGKPADNAGTSGTLTAIGNYTTVTGNKVAKASPGTHGAFQGGAVGIAQRGSCFISSSIINAGIGHGWFTTLMLDSNGTEFDDQGPYMARVVDARVGSVDAYLYANGVLVAQLAEVPATAASRMKLAYTGSKVVLEIDGLPCGSVSAAAGQRLWPKVIDYYNSASSAFPHGVIDVQHGPYTENTSEAITLVVPNANVEVFGNRLVKKAGDWTTFYSRETQRGGARFSCTPGMYPDTNGPQYAIIGLISAVPAASNDPHGYTVGLVCEGFYFHGNGNLYIAHAGSAAWAELGGGYAATDVFSVQIDDLKCSWFKNGALIYGPLAIPAGTTWRVGGQLLTGSVNNIQLGGNAEVARLGANVFNNAGTTQLGDAQLITGLGPAASVFGQTAWATLTRSIVSISKIDDAGCIIDGQALPLNGMSKSSTLAPAYPFSAGADPATQINIAATVATFAGGSTLSMPSATISGLTASTLYAIFRDLVANTFVAVSGSTTPYFTSAQRYLYIGAQATQEVGGGYEELPPPPPGSGGGYGDIPLYVPA